MKRHLNYTGRVRITREEVRIHILDEQTDGRPIFDLDLTVSPRSGFPPDARVRVEAARGNVSQRWEYGTVANLTPPSAEQRRLTHLDSTAQFKVFVIAPDGSGKLLGLADRIKPIQSIDSLIPLETADEDKLGDEVWRVEFSAEEDLPVLLVNNAIPEINDIVGHDGVFRSLVMPQVLRIVLNEIIFAGKHQPDDDEEGWWTPWFHFVDSLGVKTPAAPAWAQDAEDYDRSQLQGWIDDTVKAFAGQKAKAVPTYKTSREQRQRA